MDHNHHSSQDHPPHQNSGESCHVHKEKKKNDYILWGSITILIIAYASHMFFDVAGLYATFTGSIFELINRMYWGILIGIIFVGILSKVPREIITSLLGRGGTFSGILRATGAGVMLDLCSHGILMVGAKLYERGASLGQVMAFLIATTVAIAGPIGFIGLVSPHIARSLLKVNNMACLMTLSMSIGAIIMLAATYCSLNMLYPMIIPVGIITALIGAPFLIGLVVKQLSKN